MNRESIYYQAETSTRPSAKSFFINISLMIAGALLLQQFLPWYAVWLSCCLVGIIRSKTYGSGFWVGFLAIFLVWSIHALILDIENASILSARVVKLFPVPPYSLLLVFITGCLGGIAGGLGAATGRSLTRMLK